MIETPHTESMKIMRQSKIENYMELATVAAKRSHDAETQCGAILVKNDTGAVVATGFNGFVRGANDNDLPNTRPEKYEYMMHAEQNIIAHCARHGISMNDCTLYCTLTPCKSCMRMLWQCGITHVIAKEQYKGFDELVKLKDVRVEASVIQPSGFMELNYK